ncbi:MAG: UDP-N-acetylglucosamine 1-carboxyvinyltransferase [Chthonomonadales bacterium]
MDKIYIIGGERLTGKTTASGSKNSAVAVMAAALTVSGKVILHNVPRISDTQTMADILTSLGATSRWLGPNSIEIDATDLLWLEAPYDLVRKMRASFHVLAPLLVRSGRARVPAPGGCNIGSRPVNFHIDSLKAFGATVHLEHGVYTAETDRLKGAKIYFDLQSPGATEHMMTAAVLAEGTTVMENCAFEPEVVDVANFLNAMGAKISGAGSTTITIEGVTKLHGGEYRIIPDRIEAGTFAIAAAITQGDVLIEGVMIDHMRPTIKKLTEAGITVDEGDHSIRVKSNGRSKGVDIKTMAFPGFATDLQQPFASLLALSEGSSVITETIYENRFGYVDELYRMGADIRVEGRMTLINGVEKLMGAQVAATDLRAGAAMLLAGLAAEDETEIDNVIHIDRGYEDVVAKLKSLGAIISRGKEEMRRGLKVCSL